MYAISFLGTRSTVVSYRTEGEAWRAVHEILEEAFGDNYGETEINCYGVFKI